MKRRLALAVVVVLMMGTAFTSVNNDRLFEISKNIEIFVNVYKEINANYVDDVDPGSLMRVGIDAMLKSLDPYTNFISESQVENYRINVDGKYNGIGAILGNVDDYITIMEINENSPIVSSGLQVGDHIVEVNGLSTKGKTVEEANTILRGVSGTNLSIKVNRPYPSNTFDLEIPRSDASPGNVPYSGFVEENIGYINLTTFTANAGKNVEKAYVQLKKENPSMEGVILDLRYNGGGLLREAVNLCNIFVPKDELIVSTRGKVKERDQQYTTRNSPTDLEIPLVVLVNKKSASASEIVSGVIQDLDRGVIMGQRSYGKGLVQNQKEVGYNSRVKVTTSKYYIPSGRCIQSVDYENGEPLDIADEDRSVFKTKGGRKVLDGGGVTPDIKLEAKTPDAIVTALKKQHIIFKFVNKHVAAIKDTAKLEDIAYTDFAAFKSFADQEGFVFDLALNEAIKQMKNVETEQSYVKGVTSEISSLENKLDQLKKDAFEKNKEDILAEIEQEISSRFYYAKGKVYSTLDRDNEIKEAINLLNDESKYASLLK